MKRNRITVPVFALTILDDANLTSRSGEVKSLFGTRGVCLTGTCASATRAGDRG